MKRLLFIFAAILGIGFFLSRLPSPSLDAKTLQQSEEDPQSLAYAMNHVVSDKPEKRLTLEAPSYPEHTRPNPTDPSKSLPPEQLMPDQMSQYRAIRESSGVTILEAPERNYPLLRRERSIDGTGQTQERWMVADQLVVGLKVGVTDEAFKDILNQNRLSLLGTGAAPRSHIIHFDGIEPARMNDVIRALEQSGLFDSVDTDPIEIGSH
jgi:hypothetical protein